jgi:hypothetical protein
MSLTTRMLFVCPIEREHGGPCPTRPYAAEVLKSWKGARNQLKGLNQIKSLHWLQAVLTLSLASGQVPGRQVIPPESLHQYSGISPISTAGDKLHTFSGSGGARIVRLSDGAVIADPAPYPEAHWDNADNDLMYVLGGQTSSKPAIQTWRPSTKQYSTLIDYTGRFQYITTGATTDTTYDNWTAFWAGSEHTLCAVDLTAKKTYCSDVNAPDPINRMGVKMTASDVDYVAATPRDSKSDLHYVLLFGKVMEVFSVDETAGTLRWIVVPETPVPWMGSSSTRNNNDGNCDPGEQCLYSPHGDIFTAADGQVYFEMPVNIETPWVSTANPGTCQGGQGLLRLNAGRLMATPENLQGVTGGGMKYIGPDFSCGGYDVWSAQHTGCARWGGHCVVSFDTPAPTTQSNEPRKEELWLIGLDANNAITYTKAGTTSTSYSNANSNEGNNYWSTSRAASSMDGTQIIFDTDMGSNGAHHAVYQMETGLKPMPLPPAVVGPPPQGPPGSCLTTGDISILQSISKYLIDLLSGIAKK